MLQLCNIVKTYPAGGENIQALKGVDLIFRDNEFVSILGPSGCGKTTTLNIIGGLDQYTSGDLIINGRSTREYKDRDWDSYRNHTIGFVFQSYNLIPHQTVLQNVELALTLSGVNRTERRRRAIAALESVGLGNQLKKRPAEMSGGQMQRVAIARAIVNDPDIILADEPTGALDSETSVQVMDILKDIAKDRLVIMVTHNPELAEQYSTRIIRMLDGRVIGDSMPIREEELHAAVPVIPVEEGASAGIADAPEKSAGTAPAAEKTRERRSSMSFATAFSLSLRNLFTKKGRTLLTSFAGSIGIIGIALIFAVSQGTNDYIDTVQEDTLTGYPLSITSETADISAILSGVSSSAKRASEGEEGTVTEQQMISSMFAGVGTNDLKSFRTYLTEHYGEVEEDINALKYSYGLTPHIYTRDINGKLLRANPGMMSSYMARSAYSSYFRVFSEMLDNIDMLDTQYDVLAGRWPQEYNELILVLNDPKRLSDMVTYTIGLHDPEELSSMVEKAMNGETVDAVTETFTWTYDELLQLEFRLVERYKYYRYNEEHNIWENLNEDTDYLESLYDGAEVLHVVGIVCAKEGSNASTLSSGFCYLPSLTEHMIESASNADIVKQQKADRETDVISGKRFDEMEQESGLDFKDMITVDGSAIASAFHVNISEEDITRLLSAYLSEVAGDLRADTVGAFNDFTDIYEQLATGMLKSYIAANAGGDGGAELSIDQADSIAAAYMQTEEATALIQPLVPKYGLPLNSYVPVYQSLLSGLIRTYVMENAATEEKTATAAGEDAPAPVATAHLREGSGARIRLLTAVTLSDKPVPLSDLPAAAAEEPDNTQSDSGTAVSTPAPENETASTEDIPPAAPTQTDAPDTDPAIAGNTGETDPVGDSGANGDGNAENTGENGETDVPPADGDSAESDPADPSPEPGPDTPEEPEPEPSPVPEIPGVDIEEVLEEINSTAVRIYPEQVNSVVSSYGGTALVTGTAAAMSAQMSEAAVRATMNNAVKDFVKQAMPVLSRSLSVDGDKIANAFSFDMTEEEMTRLLTTLNGDSSTSSAEDNLTRLGYAELDSPTSISVYLRDFESKEHFVSFIDDYNALMEEQGKDEQVIRYTDITGVLMSSVTTIINAITYVLIAFVSISLVVSSIMIGVITLISVQERTKEIGILRAIGASKGNVSSMFNAETVIIGFTSGLIGVMITYLLCIPINIVLLKLTNIASLRATLPVYVAVALVLISMTLTLIAGIIPSRSAAKKDPVVALRSE